MYINNYIVKDKTKEVSLNSKDWVRIKDKTYRIVPKNSDIYNIILSCTKNIEYLIINDEYEKISYTIEAPKVILLNYLSETLQPTSKTFNKFIYDNELY